MALWEFTNLNKYGNRRTRIIYTQGSLNVSKGFGSYVFAKRFKYTYEHSLIPPSLFIDSQGQKFIIPTWQKVLPETTLEDIQWVKPKNPTKKLEHKEWKFESKSNPNHFYIVTQVSDFKVKCTCTGQYRAKDRKCRHMKEVMKELGIK